MTICTHSRKCLFGQINEGEMIFNNFAKIIHNEWIKTGQIRENVKLDEFVIMPNHLHGIIFISNDDRRGVLQYAPTNEFRSPSQTIGSIIRGFKSTTTKQINKSRNTPRLPLWQRNYYEHVIRNVDDFNSVREYIINNPLRWANDRENICDKIK